MKFIVDAQLPKSLSDFFNDMGLDSIHILDLPNRNKTKDGQIAKLANDQDRIAITKDADFLESFIIKAETKKLIIIKTGNILNSDLLNVFKDNIPVLLKLISRSNLLEISRTEIVEHG